MEAVDECWNFAQECEQWAGKEKDAQVRNAFYRMARGFAQLAFQERDPNKVQVLKSSDAEASLTLLALALHSEQLSVPASKLRDGRGDPSIDDAVSNDLQKCGDPEQPAEPMPDAVAKGGVDADGRE